MSRLVEQLEREEGRKATVYYDSEGFATIGVGILIDPRKGGGLRPEEINFLRDNRIRLATGAILERFEWAAGLNEPRFAVLLNMCYQMGLDGLAGFRKAIEAIRDERWETAAVEMLDSRWAKQTPERAKRMARQMETGEWQS